MNEAFWQRPASPTQLPAWQALAACAQQLADTRIDALFSDAQRSQRWTFVHDGLRLDCSKQRADENLRQALLQLAAESGLTEGIAALFAGAAFNFTEGRPALHMALRGSTPPPAADAARLHDSAQAMRQLARRLRNGQQLGSTGAPIRHVINLGIGGSDLGPRMATEALSPAAQAQAPQVRFVANIDPRELDEALADLDPAATLFIVSSKSFTTLETLANARAARAWLHAHLGPDAELTPHFFAVTQQPEAAQELGIPPEQVFAIPAWAGGRFSVWSAVGLPLLIAIGEDAFDALLAGAASMDEHFRDAPFEHNLPVMLGLLGIWNINFLGIESLAVMPYAHGLRSFPTWLQQLDMESNGKHCLIDGSKSIVHTAPLLFGQAGTLSQHAFHQLLYQGTRQVAADFIVPVLGHDERARALYENALAQSAALMLGRDLDAARNLLRQNGASEAEIEALAPHLVCPGNQPSTTLLLPDLSPATLGGLMALYEHKTFVQGWIWGINSFDQYGVELGKAMARQIASPETTPPHPSTAALLQAIEQMQRSSS